MFFFKPNKTKKFLNLNKITLCNSKCEQIKDNISIYNYTKGAKFDIVQTHRSHF